MATPSLPKLKDYLNIPAGSTAYDTELPTYLGAARETMRARCGPDEPTTVTEQSRVRCGRTVVNELPVIEVTSITDRAGDVVDITDLDLDEASGVLTGVGAHGWCGRATITYRAGHDPCPDDLELAIYVVAGHVWDTQRGRSGSFSQIHGLDDDAPVGGDASYLVLRGFALPRRAMELARPYLKPRI